MPHIPQSLPPSRGVPPEISAALKNKQIKPMTGLAGESEKARTLRVGMPTLSVREWTVDPMTIAKNLLGKDFERDYAGRLVPTGTHGTDRSSGLPGTVQPRS